jgi:hypothetical protein
MPRPSSTPQSNYSLAWLAPPCRYLLCSRCLPELLHTPVVLSPWPRSGQAYASPPLCPGHPPHPGPTTAQRGWLLHIAASSATSASPSSSMPRPSCHPGPGPIKPTCCRLYALAVLHALLQLQPGVASSSTPLPSLELTPPRAPPLPGHPVTPAPVRSSRRATTSMPRPSSTPQPMPPRSPACLGFSASMPHRSSACPGSSTSPPNHRPPTSTSVQCLSATQLGLMALDITGPAASFGRHQPPRAASFGCHRPAALGPCQV